MAGYRPMYTVDEDMIILKMIIEGQHYYHVRGKAFWVDMQNSGLIDRTWQSLKERFDKHILPKINDRKYWITDVERKKIQVAYKQIINNPYKKHIVSNVDMDSNESDDNDSNN